MNHKTGYTNSSHKSSIALEQLAEILSAYYDVERKVHVNNRQVDLLAQSTQNLQHYAISKKLVLDESQLNDYLVIQRETSAPTADVLMQHFTWLKEWAKGKILSDERHMRSRFVHVLLLEENWLPNNFERMVKKFCESRWLNFGINGWYDTILICYHLPTHSIYSHRKGQDFFDLLEKISKFDLPKLTTKENKI